MNNQSKKIHDGSIKHAEGSLYLPTDNVLKSSHLQKMSEYKRMYYMSVINPKQFWGQIAKQFYWKLLSENNNVAWNFDVGKGEIFTRWFKGSKTNVSYNCLDRHIINGCGNRIAYFWEGNDPSDTKEMTYRQLHQEVCKLANVLKSKGLQKGDTVSIYMPMIPELVVAMLACARLGLIHSIIFAGFSAKSLCVRFLSAKPKLVITADAFWRGTKLINLKNICDEAIQLYEKEGNSIPTVIWKRHLNPKSGEEGKEEAGTRPFKVEINITKGRDVSWNKAMSKSSIFCEPVWVDAEDPLFILHTSGSTGVPKPILHTNGGYMIYTATTFKYSFDYKHEDIFWCTADLGWITGHSYICYGPLLNCASSVMFEGVMTFPDVSRFWKMCDKYKVNQFYTSPTAIRSLMSYDEKYITETSTRNSLRIIGTVGEPINPDVWEWYYRVVGNSRCAVIDTYWQTETGGHIITPLPCFNSKPGSATLPFFGIVPVILDENGKELKGKADGYLAIKQAWPGIMRSIYGDYKRYKNTYFQRFPGYYVTGDGAHRDEDGYFWITGRIDDMLNVSGHLLSTAEVEAVLVQHPMVVEAAAVTAPHNIKGECIYCFVSLHQGEELTREIEKEIKMEVRNTIGAFAAPEYIQYAKAMPKTRSGKIIRRVLRQIAKGGTEYGDLSSLNDYSVIEDLVAGHKLLFSQLTKS